MPKIDSFMRWIYLFDDSETLTRKYYICEILLAYLFSSGISSITAKEAVEYLEREDNFGILFTVEEVEEALNSKLNQYFDRSGDDNYSISSNGLILYSKRPKENGLRIHITRYIKQAGLDIEKYDQISECLLTYIYEQFCTNVSAIARILTGHQIAIEQIGKYSPEEVGIVNDFLNWPDTEKNKYVAELFARAYDFCVIASDCAENKTIDFNKCIFYLDTNVIFRLAGLNNESRRELSSRFIKKSLELKCNIKYTHFTKKELYKAIDRQINYIESICRDFSLIEPAEFEPFMPIGMSIDVYTVYYIWTQKGKSKNDYAAFKLSLYEKCEAILDSFTIDEDTPSFFSSSQGFPVDSMKDSIKRTMPDKLDDTIKTDINNLLVVTQERKRSNDSTISFITTDKRLIRWAADTFGGLSLAELPSVWLSIMLRFGGRTSNHDYEAFCQFIKLPLGGTPESLPDKLDLLACVQLATDDADIKKRMLRELRINSEEYKYIKSAEEKTITAGQTVIKSMYNQMHDTIKKQVEEETSTQYSGLLAELEQEAEQSKANSIQALRDEFEEYKIRENEIHTNRIVEIKKAAKLETIRNLAVRQAKNQLIGYWFIFSFIVLVAIGILIYGVILVCEKAAQPGIDALVGYFGILVSVALFFTDALIYKKAFKEMDKEKLTCHNIFALGGTDGLSRKDLVDLCKVEGYMD